MSKLEFLDWQGAEHTFDFIGWNSGRAEGGFLDASAFVLDAKQHRQVLQLRLPYLKPASYQRDPFPKHAPTRIERFRLIPPPCRATKEQAARLLGVLRELKYPDAEGKRPPAWEAVYGEVLYPEPQDESELKATLKSWLATQEQEYRRLTDELTKFYGNTSTKEHQHLEARFHGPQFIRPGLSLPGLLQTTIPDVKARNVGNIRDYVLARSWAKQNTFDLDEMAQDNEAFLARWIELKQPVASGSWSHNSILALVQYRIHFADGGRFWLSDCQLRALQTPEETRAFDDLLKVRGTGESHPPPKPKRRKKGTPEPPVAKAYVCEQWGVGWARARQICRAKGLDHERLTASEVGKVKRERERDKLRLKRNLQNRTKRRHQKRRGAQDEP